MAKSEKDGEIKALKAALKREQKKVADLKTQHQNDKTEIKNLKRRKDPELKSKKKDRKDPKAVKVTEKQRQLLLKAFPDIDILSLLSD